MTGTLEGWTIAIDLDGTLVDTAPDLSNALNHVLALQSLSPVPLADIRSMVGHGAKAMIRKGLSWNGADIDDQAIDDVLWPAFIEHYTAHICDESRPFPGVTGAMDALIGAGAQLAICTNKSQTLAERVLDTLGFSSRMSAIVGADTASIRKPNAAHLFETIEAAGGTRCRALLVGDSDTDERAARNAELPFIFVSFGYGELTPNPLPSVKTVDEWSSIPTTVFNIADGRTN